MSEDHTLQEAADALGVHYMTAYRYVRTGLLTADKVGGVWRVRSEDLDAFSARPNGRRGRGSRAWSEWVDRLESRLLAGDRVGAATIIDSVLAGGADFPDLYLEVIAPTLVSIGAAWERGEIDVATEHRASVIVTQLLGRVGDRFNRRGVSKGQVIIGGVPGERHALPVTIVSDLVRFHGFDVDDLGADVPADSFGAIVAGTERLVCVGLSATTPSNEDAIRGTVRAIRAASDQAPILLGGAAIADEETARDLGADLFAADARQASELIAGLVDLDVDDNRTNVRYLKDGTGRE